MSEPSFDRDVQADWDRGIFEDLYPSLRRFAAVVGGLDVDPDDLVQEAVAQALRRAPLHELDNPAGYLRTAILRLEMNRRRSAERQLRAYRLAHRASDESGVYPSDLDILRILSPPERAVVYLSVLEQRPFHDVARLLGISEAAARKRVSRALRRLSAALDEEARRG